MNTEKRGEGEEGRGGVGERRGKGGGEAENGGTKNII